MLQMTITFDLAVDRDVLPHLTTPLQEEERREPPSKRALPAKPSKLLQILAAAAVAITKTTNITHR